jgi:hypothetical protein
MRACVWACCALLTSSTAATAQQIGGPELAETLARTARRVEDYYARARTLVSTEHVLIEPLGTDLLPAGLGRRLVYELRVEWDPPGAGQPDGDAQVVRRLVSANGRATRPDGDPGCIDPAPVSPEPLAIFRAAARHRYAFTWAGRGQTDGRASVMLDYRHAMPAEPEVVWKDECVSINVPAKTLGRAWLDSETGDILRLDERFDGQFDVPVPWEHQRHGSPALMTIIRNDTSIRYRQFQFSDPDETLLLPATIDTVSIVRNSGSPRVRVKQTFSDYRRFTTDSRIVK